jgi:hypothetical protein
LNYTRNNNARGKAAWRRAFLIRVQPEGLRFSARLKIRVGFFRKSEKIFAALIEKQFLG